MKKANENKEIITPEIAEKIPEAAAKEIGGEWRQLAPIAVGFKVRNEGDYKQASELILRAKSMLKRIQSLHTAVAQPIKRAGKEIDQIFKDLKTPFADMETELRTGMERYIESRKTKRSIRGLQEEGGVTTVTQSFDYEITDPAKVQRKYLTVDEAKLGRIVRSGGLQPGEYPGFRVFMRAGVQVKTKD